MSQKFSHSIFKGKLQGQILGSVLEELGGGGGGGGRPT